MTSKVLIHFYKNPHKSFTRLFTAHHETVPLLHYTNAQCLETTERPTCLFMSVSGEDIKTPWTFENGSMWTDMTFESPKYLSHTSRKGKKSFLSWFSTRCLRLNPRTDTFDRMRAAEQAPKTLRPKHTLFIFFPCHKEKAKVPHIFLFGSVCKQKWIQLPQFPISHLCTRHTIAGPLVKKLHFHQPFKICATLKGDYNIFS